MYMLSSKGTTVVLSCGLEPWSLRLHVRSLPSARFLRLPLDPTVVLREIICDSRYNPAVTVQSLLALYFLKDLFDKGEVPNLDS